MVTRGWLADSICIISSRVRAAARLGRPAFTSVPPSRRMVIPMTSRSSSQDGELAGIGAVPEDVIRD
jgi:hypothetical protein